MGNNIRPTIHGYFQGHIFGYFWTTEEFFGHSQESGYLRCYFGFGYKLLKKVEKEGKLKTKKDHPYGVIIHMAVAFSILVSIMDDFGNLPFFDFKEITAIWMIISEVIGLQSIISRKSMEGYDICSYLGVKPKIGVGTQIIHFNRVLHYFHHPFWCKIPYFGVDTHLALRHPNQQKWIWTWKPRIAMLRLFEKNIYAPEN